MLKSKSKFFILSLLTAVVYFVTRLINLTSIPVFCDEAIYIRWAQIIKTVDTMRFIPLSDGKQPLFMWVLVPFFKFITDPLVAGRLVSILTGFGTIIFLFLIFKFIFKFKNWYCLIPALIYIFLPFTFFFDRLSLADNMLAFFGTGSLFFSLLLAKYPRLDLSMILGIFLGLSWLTKSPAIYFLVLSLVTFLAINKNNYKKIYFPFISLVLSFVIYNILRLGPQFHQIALRNKDYVWSISEILKHPLDPLLPHIIDIFNIYLSYISWPLIIILVLGLIFFKNQKNKLIIFIISLWWILPTISNAIFAKVFTARYILFTIPSLIILISLSIVYFCQKFNQKSFLLVFLLIPNILFINKLSFSPFTATLPPTEAGYLKDWTSGWGIESASKYLLSNLPGNNIFVGTEGYFGTLPDGLQIYTANYQNIEVAGIGMDFNNIPAKLLEEKKSGKKVYLLINQSRLKLFPTEISKIEVVGEYQKPDNDKLILFKI